MAIRKIDNKWYVDIRFDGHRYRKRSIEDSRKGALAYERLLRCRLLETGSLKPKEASQKAQKTLRVFTEDWLKTYVKTNNKSSEISRKQSILSIHLWPFFGDIELDEINSRIIERYNTEKILEEVSPKTINNQLSVLRKALACALEWGELQRLPQVKWLKVPPVKVDFLSNVETGRLLADEKEPLWNTMVFVALRTGMRISEMLALRWDDVDFEESLICVRRSACGKEVNSPKNNHIRYINMTTGLHQRLFTWKHEIHGKQSGLVFPSPDTGEMLRRSSASEAFERVCKRTDVRKIGWHTLRHTFATQLTAKGVPIRAVQSLLGHQSIKMTERYSHVSPDTMRQAVMVLEGEWMSFGQYVGSEEKQMTEIGLRKMCL